MSKSEGFKPAWWLPGSHLQTLWPTFCRRLNKSIVFQRERLELPDGDFIDLDWVNADTNAPIVVVLHGLEGSSESPYANGMLMAMQNQGWRGVLMHFRSCSGELNRHARAYHSGDTTDVAYLIKTIRDREPDALLAAVGFSLGGNVLLKWLGETGDTNPLSAAVAISVPFELANAVDRVQYGFSRIYQWHFLKSLLKKIQQKLDTKKIQMKIPPLANVKTLHEFDDKITAPLHGFINAEDYYQRSSCRQFLRKISVPTLVLQSRDDPFMTADVLPNPHELSTSIVLELTNKGGHVGFVAGKTPWHVEYWLESRVPNFLQNYLAIK